MRVAGWLMIPVDPPSRGVRLVRGVVRIDKGIIAEITAVPGQRSLPRAELGSDRTLVCPGFVDTHLHLPQFDVIGVDGLTLLDWLEQAVFPAEVRWEDADYAGRMAQRVARTLLSHGTTCIAAYGTVHHKGTLAAMRAAADAGLRGFVGQVLMDRGAPKELLRPAGQLLKEAAKMRGAGRIGPAITPRFAVSCSRGLLKGCGQLAAKTHQPVQTHLAESREECALVKRLHGGLDYCEVYRRAGLLTDRTILGHGIWLNGAQRKSIAAAGSVIAHCPTANLFLGAGWMDRALHHKAGVRTSLGSDIAGGPDISMVRVARAMVETAKRLGKPLPGAGECWWQITAGNGQALGLADAGVLRVGAPADMVTVEPWRGEERAGTWPLEESTLSALMYGWDDRWLRATIAAGEVKYQG